MRAVPQPFRTPLASIAWAALVLAVGGYRYGVADHGIHIPFLDMVLHPERWTGDVLVVATASHHSWFSHVQAPFAEAMGPAAWSAVVYLGVLISIGWTLIMLGRTLGFSERASWLGAAVLAIGYDAPGGVATLDPLLVHRMAALPIQLAALVVLLRGRVVAGFALCGLSLLIHAPSAVALAFGMTFGHVVLLRMQAAPSIEVGTSGVREASSALLGPPAGFVLGASPLLVPWLVGAGPGRSLVLVDGAWWDVLVARLPHHLMPGTWPTDVWISFGLWLAVATVATLALVRFADGPRAEARALIAVGAGCFAYAVSVGTVAGPVARIALGLQLEAWQATRFLIVASCLVTVGTLDVLWHQERRSFALGLAALLLATAVLSRSDEPRRFEPAGPDNPEASVARWAADNTEEGAVFMVPPAAFGAFRALSLRPVVATWKEGGEATFSRDVAMEWKRRVERVCACVIQGSGTGELRQGLREGWAGRTLEGIRQTAVEEGADWIVVEASRAEDVVFTAAPWAVMRAPEVARRVP